MFTSCPAHLRSPTTARISSICSSGRFFQLAGAMFQRAFAQQVNDAAAGSVYPVHRRMPVYENEHAPTLGSILRRAAQSHIIFTCELPFRHRARSNFHPVRLQVLPAANGHHQVFAGQKDTPLVCSPSRSVVSMISILTMFHVSSPRILFYFILYKGNLYRPIRSSGSVSCRH